MLMPDLNKHLKVSAYRECWVLFQNFLELTPSAQPQSHPYNSNYFRFDFEFKRLNWNFAVDDNERDCIVLALSDNVDCFVNYIPYDVPLLYDTGSVRLSPLTQMETPPTQDCWASYDSLKIILINVGNSFLNVHPST